jgi:hypothetical protein
MRRRLTAGWIGRAPRPSQTVISLSDSLALAGPEATATPRARAMAGRRVMGGGSKRRGDSGPASGPTVRPNAAARMWVITRGELYNVIPETLEIARNFEIGGGAAPICLMVK